MKPFPPFTLPTKCLHLSLSVLCATLDVGGQPHHCWGCLGSSAQPHQGSLSESCSIFWGVQDHSTAPCKQAQSEHWLLWSGLSPEASGWSLRQEMLRKGAGCLPCCSWRIWVGRRGQRGEGCVISSEGRDAAKRYPRFEEDLSAYRTNLFTYNRR